MPAARHLSRLRLPPTPPSRASSNAAACRRAYLNACCRSRMAVADSLRSAAYRQPYALQRILSERFSNIAPRSNACKTSGRLVEYLSLSISLSFSSLAFYLFSLLSSGLYLYTYGSTGCGWQLAATCMYRRAIAFILAFRSLSRCSMPRCALATLSLALMALSLLSRLHSILLSRRNRSPPARIRMACDLLRACIAQLGRLSAEGRLGRNNAGAYARASITLTCSALPLTHRAAPWTTARAASAFSLSLLSLSLCAWIPNAGVATRLLPAQAGFLRNSRRGGTLSATAIPATYSATCYHCRLPPACAALSRRACLPPPLLYSAAARATLAMTPRLPPATTCHIQPPPPYIACGYTSPAGLPACFSPACWGVEDVRSLSNSMGHPPSRAFCACFAGTLASPLCAALFMSNYYLSHML